MSLYNLSELALEQDVRLTRSPPPRAALSAVPQATAATQAELGVMADSNTPPYDGIVTIYDQIGSGYFQASGVLISPDEVLTASHVLYSTGEAPATNIEVVAGASASPNDQGAYYEAANIHYFPIDDTGGTISLQTSQTDYAVIHLSEPVTGRTIFDPISNFNGGVATVAGYPGDTNLGGQPNLISDTDTFYVDPNYTLLFGPALGPGSSGGPVFISGTDGETHVAGIVSSYDLSQPTVGSDVLITQTVFNQIESWVAQDDGTTPPLIALDTSAHQSFDPHGVAYHGPVAGLTGQYIDITQDNLNVTATTNNWFIHSGAGEDALQARGGINVLDGGTGSNFLVGGTGAGSMDTFFTDDRNTTASIWDTLVHFHAGDAATLFGVTQAGFSFDWVNGQGAAGYTGLTLHATSPGHAEASVTLAGYTSAALTDGQLTIVFGTTQGIPYMYIHGNF